MAELSYTQISALLKYDPESGKLFWLPRPLSLFPNDRAKKTWNTKFSGMEAFTARNSNGYRHGQILGCHYKAHRVAWLLHYGEWPKGDIDHLNGDPSDNRISNIRDVHHAENSRNQKRRKNNTSGVCGVIWREKSQKWYAYIRVNYMMISLGLFDNFDDAVSARAAANAEYGFTDRHGDCDQAKKKQH